MPLYSRINAFTRNGSPKNGPSPMKPVVRGVCFDAETLPPAEVADESRFSASKRSRTKADGDVSGTCCFVVANCWVVTLVGVASVVVVPLSKSFCDQLTPDKPCTSSPHADVAAATAPRSAAATAALISIPSPSKSLQSAAAAAAAVERWLPHIERSHRLKSASISRRYCVDLYICDSSASMKSSSAKFSSFSSIAARCCSM